MRGLCKKESTKGKKRKKKKSAVAGEVYGDLAEEAGSATHRVPEETNEIFALGGNRMTSQRGI